MDKWPERGRRIPLPLPLPASGRKGEGKRRAAVGGLLALPFARESGNGELEGDFLIQLARQGHF
jgi:hypothetical protein